MTKLTLTLFLLGTGFIWAQKDVFDSILQHDLQAVNQFFKDGGNIDQKKSRKVDQSLSKKHSKEAIEVSLFEYAINGIRSAQDAKDPSLIRDAYAIMDTLLGRLDQSTERQSLLNKTFTFAISLSNVELVRKLHQMGADINQRCDLCYGRTPALIAVALNEDLEMIKFLFSLNPDFGIKDYDNRGYLHYAAVNGNIPLLEYLLDNKIEDINVKDTIGRTPIFDAVLQGDIETYNFLLSRGAKTDVVVNGDISLLDEASTTGDLNFFRQVYYTSGLPINEETFPKSELKKHVWDSEILIFIEREIAFTKLQNN